MMKTAIDWVTSSSAAGEYPFLELSRIAVAGQSCGGVEAYDRVSALGLFNSGLMTAAASQKAVPRIEKPIFYFLGGPSDIAYANGERDFTLLPVGTPSWKGNLAVGHSGTYKEKNAGKFGVAAVRFVQWLLRGEEEAAGFFNKEVGEAETAGWEVERKNLGKIEVSPL